MSVVIKVENVSKQYRLGAVGTGSLTHDVNRAWHRIRGKEDPYLQVGEVNDRAVTGSSEYVWALKDINFEIKKGDAVGIIGRNGAGKSTLLKILSRTTSPTTGFLKLKGRVASLLEVGTGFHPELSGRENIFLNGAILGMTKAEIKTKLDEIIFFSGVERYIDTPVKRYSSGMYVRLAFAVVAHLESEILILDEVLAVGDAEFQKKCLGKMDDVTKKEGRTVLFVSHNLQAVQKFCTKGILLQHGEIKMLGSIGNVLERYMQADRTDELIFKIPEPLSKNEINGYATKLQIENSNGELVNEVPVGRAWQIRIQFTINRLVEHFIIALGVVNMIDIPVVTSFSEPMLIEKGEYEIIFKNPTILLATGAYNLFIGLSSFEVGFHSANGFAYLNIAAVSDVVKNNRIIRTSGVGMILNPFDYEIIKC